MSTQRKVVVIGAGPAGYVCAIRLAQLGQDVTIVERDQLGGTCLNVGCIPSKALIAAGAHLERIEHGKVMGVTAESVSLDLGQLVEWKQGIVARLTGTNEEEAREMLKGTKLHPAATMDEAVQLALELAGEGK